MLVEPRTERILAETATPPTRWALAEVHLDVRLLLTDHDAPDVTEYLAPLCALRLASSV